MKAAAAEVQQVVESVGIWHRYDAGIKADLFSSALTTAAGVFLVDPIPLDDAGLAEITRGCTIAGFVVTNANHLRAAAAFREKFAAPLYISAADAIAGAQSTAGGDQLATDLQVIAIDGAAPGELALHCTRAGGTLVIGDALINFGSYGFTFLPAKYATNVKRMRRSLRQLLDFRFERILFAHGTPLTSKAYERLGTLLDNAS